MKFVDPKDDFVDEWKNESENVMELICDDEQKSENIEVIDNASENVNCFSKKEFEDESTVEGMHSHKEKTEDETEDKTEDRIKLLNEKLFELNEFSDGEEIVHGECAEQGKKNIVDGKLLKEQVKDNMVVRIVEESHENFLNKHEHVRKLVTAKNAKFVTLFEKKNGEDLMFKKESRSD